MIGYVISFIYWFCQFSIRLSHTILPALEYSRPNLSKTWQVVKTVLKGWNDKHIDWMSAVWKTVLHSAEMVQLLIVFPFSTHTHRETHTLPPKENVIAQSSQLCRSINKYVSLIHLRITFWVGKILFIYLKKLIIWFSKDALNCSKVTERQILQNHTIKQRSLAEHKLLEAHTSELMNLEFPQRVSTKILRIRTIFNIDISWTPNQHILIDLISEGFTED